jgi:hypothetical protein
MAAREQERLRLGRQHRVHGPCLDGRSHPAGAGHGLGWSDVPLPDALLFASAWLPTELWSIHTRSARSDNPSYVNLGATVGTPKRNRADLLR